MVLVGYAVLLAEQQAGSTSPVLRCVQQGRLPRLGKPQELLAHPTRGTIAGDYICKENSRVVNRLFVFMITYDILDNPATQCPQVVGAFALTPGSCRVNGNQKRLLPTPVP